MSNNMFMSESAVISNNQNYLKRSRIEKLLKKAIQKPAVTVIAGTGFGKTQTLYSFLLDADVITIWQQLTSLDNICMRFWRNLTNVVSLHDKKLAHNMQIIGFPDTVAQFNMFLGAVLDSDMHGKKYVVVFDDFYLINEKKILLLLENIINADIPNLCIVVISRNEPEINLTDLLMKNMVFTITEEDLRFNRSDLYLYFEMQDIRMLPQTLTKIYDHTNGWIFAIRMIELSIKQGAPHEEHAIDAMKLNIFKLIENKIFSDMPEEVQTFFIKLSLFQSLPAELVRLLASHNEQLIDEAVKINSFVRYDSFANIYCIHHLFLDFLKQKQDMLTQIEKNTCYLAAAGWYAANGYQIDAINYYGLAEDYNNMIAIVVALPYTLPVEVAVLLLDILAKAPAQAFEQQPLLLVLRARVLVSLGKSKEAMAELNALKAKHEARPLTLQSRSLLCEAYLVEAINNYLVCVSTNEFDFLRPFMKAYENMPHGSEVLKERDSSHAVGCYVCRVGSEKPEDMERFIATVTETIPHASKVINGNMSGLDDLAEAELAYFRNQTRSAENFAHHALYIAGQNGQYEIESRALFYLLRIALAAGDYGKVKDILGQLDLQFEEKMPNNKMLYDIIFSWLYSVIGCGDEIASWLKSNFVKNNMGMLASGIGNLATMKYYISDKRYEDLLTFAENAENTFGIELFLFGRIAIAINKAVCYYRTGKQEKALAFLRTAYDLALPNAIIMQFVELGNDMVSLTKYALKSEFCTIPDDWLQNIFRKSSTYAKRVAHVATEYKNENQLDTNKKCRLTKKELEFLTDLCHGMSIAEIALHHDVSKKYVSNRLQTIYSKLGAQNIKDAIHIATLMKLVK